MNLKNRKNLNGDVGKANKKPDSKELTASDIAYLALQIDEPELDETKRKLLAYKLLPEGVIAKNKIKAEMIGVTERRIYQIEADPKFRELCVKYVKQNIGKYIPEVWQAFFKNAIDGDTQAQLIILRETGVLSDAKKDNDTPINLNLTIEQVEQKRSDNLKTGLSRFGYNTDKMPISD